MKDNANQKARVEEESSNAPKESNLKNFEKTFIHDWQKALRRVEEGRKCCEHLSRIFQELICIEKEYEQNLKNLCNSFKEFSDESSGIKNGIMSLKKNIERRCEQIADFVNYMESEIIYSTLNTTLINHKNVYDQIRVDGMESDKMVERTKKDTVKYVQNCVCAYENLVDSILVFHNSTYYHPLKRIELSNVCIYKYLLAKKREYEYKNIINNVNQVELKKEKKMKSILYSLESMDYKRISCIKDNVMKYLIFFTSYIRNVQYDLNGCIDVFKDVDPSREIEEFCELYCAKSGADGKRQGEDSFLYNNIVSWPMLMDHRTEFNCVGVGSSYGSRGDNPEKGNYVSNAKSKYGNLFSSLFNVNAYKNLIQSEHSDGRGANSVYTNIFNEIVFFNKKEVSSEGDNDAEENEPVEENDAEENEPVEENDAEENEPVEENDAEENEPVEENDAEENEPVEENDAEENEQVEENDAVTNEAGEDEMGHSDPDGNADRQNIGETPNQSDVLNRGKEILPQGEEEETREIPAQSGKRESSDGETNSMVRPSSPGEVSSTGKGFIEDGHNVDPNERKPVANLADGAFAEDSIKREFVQVENLHEGRINPVEEVGNQRSNLDEGGDGHSVKRNSVHCESDLSYTYVRDMLERGGTHNEQESDSGGSEVDCTNRFKKIEIFFQFYLKNLFHGNFTKIEEFNISSYFNVYNNRIIFCECLMYYVKKGKTFFKNMDGMVIFARIILSFLDYCDLYFDYWSSIYILVASENFYFEVEENYHLDVKRLLEECHFFEKFKRGQAGNRGGSAVGAIQMNAGHVQGRRKNNLGMDDFFIIDEDENGKEGSPKARNVGVLSKMSMTSSKARRSVVNIYESREDVEKDKQVDSHSNSNAPALAYVEDSGQEQVITRPNESSAQEEEPPNDDLPEDLEGKDERKKNCEQEVNAEKKNTGETDIPMNSGECKMVENSGNTPRRKKILLHKFLYAHNLWNNIKFWEVSLLVIISEIIQESVLLEKLKYENKESLIKKYFFFFKYFNFYNSMIDFGLSINQIGLLLNKVFHSFDLKNDPISRKYFFQIIDIATNKKITLNYIKTDVGNLNSEYKKYYLQYYNNYLNDDSRPGAKKS
ncbi:conserved Plasmodium protein, unknown function [Plasmodium knowlesi strain H]|uniref:FCH domain-containing protein n=3 Tax=Plasmodium knowlesi TaxID=5850 RepID=A0A5K1VRZ3_PLAKH|nr:conserved Plasmodium protein, unknown function [Plasmodium knowlesi strain H]OTN65150.1 Uncharacterized protein PKNOH_S120120300 [Plasmodium knowlesi]CAA9988069.1 conserved Plasmodium protein, unknown function [Plasmodium knowlesi strain H]SBO19926.1 conserved Plasmodium protein, unknown function [Plasmodium knowlesi strain H]SBO29073.1 conserved Plasmodium protein, unknown function [Plasmodium knowlesi strain H]VVS77543.1 conserved Plasmodium protein, unknown function [Plasmodium knowlesi |eukprot:XP_002259043.1 hypothetical protein, conserved in Plasmodium species [Plasmodium knowlesi strain H]